MTCDVTVDGIRNVTAFVAPFFITITKAGDLSNTIVYTRTGTTCGPGCRRLRMRLSSAHEVGIQVLGAPLTFTAWGRPPCEVPSRYVCTFFATQSVDVVAAFCNGSPFPWLCLPTTSHALEFKPVVVYRSGRGSVELRWADRRASCAKARCRYLGPIDTRVTFMARPSSRFAQWNSAFCRPGNATCAIKSDLVDSIRVVFRP
jgi:hypothetical protein